MILIDLSLTNNKLYNNCVMVEAGRKNLVTPIPEAINKIGENVEAIIASTPVVERDTVVLTGPMAVWSYLIVFHACIHKFGSVYYNDGKMEGLGVLVAKHG